MGGGRWRLGLGVLGLLSLQSRGVTTSHSELLGAAGPGLLLEELAESLTRAAPVEVLAPEPLGEPEHELEQELEVVEPRDDTPRLVPACGQELALVGAVVNERRPELSRVVVRMPGGSMVVAAGGRIGDFVVDAVQAAGALLRDQVGGLCALREFSGVAHGEAAPAPAPPEDEEPVKPRGKRVFSPEELADGLQKLGEGDYLVKKAFLLKALTNPGGSAGGAWFRAAQLDGASTGMEVLGIRAGTALEAMGVRNGDVLHDLNGISLDAAGNLIAALRSAREAEHVAIHLLRDGRPEELRYRVE